MPLTSPDLVRSYASPAEKDAYWQRLLQRAEALRGLAGTPQERVPADVAARLQVATPIADEAPAQRLSRHASPPARDRPIRTPLCQPRSPIQHKRPARALVPP